MQSACCVRTKALVKFCLCCDTSEPCLKPLRSIMLLLLNECLVTECSETLYCCHIFHDPWIQLHDLMYYVGHDPQVTEDMNFSKEIASLHINARIQHSPAHFFFSHFKASSRIWSQSINGWSSVTLSLVPVSVPTEGWNAIISVKRFYKISFGVNPDSTKSPM